MGVLRFSLITASCGHLVIASVDGRSTNDDSVTASERGCILATSTSSWSCTGVRPRYTTSKIDRLPKCDLIHTNHLNRDSDRTPITCPPYSHISTMSGGGSSSNGTKDPHPNPLGSNPVNKAFEFNTTFTSDGPTNFDMATPVPEQSTMSGTPTSHRPVSTRPMPQTQTRPALSREIIDIDRTQTRPALTRQITDIDRRWEPVGPDAATHESQSTYLSDGTTFTVHVTTSAPSEEITGPVPVVAPYETPGTANTTDGPTSHYTPGMTTLLDGPTSNYSPPRATEVIFESLPAAGAGDGVDVRDFAPTSAGLSALSTSHVPVTVASGSVGLWDLRTIDTTLNGSPITTCDTPAGSLAPSSTVAVVSTLTQAVDHQILEQHTQHAPSSLPFTTQGAVTSVVASLLAIHLYESAKATQPAQPRLLTTLILTVIVAISLLGTSVNATGLDEPTDDECSGACLIILGIGMFVLCTGILAVLTVVGMQLSKRAGSVRRQETSVSNVQTEAEREADEGRRRTRGEDMGVGKGDAML